MYGTLDDFELIAEEVSKADITCCWASCEHEADAKAIASGFAIHLSGADNICFPDLNAETYGKKGDRIFEDSTDLEEILAPDNKAPHREVDLAILEAAKKGGKTAIVCPPTIYGPGRGPRNQRSIQVPELASHILKRGRALTVEGGKNIWNSMHIHDLANLFLKLIEAAAEGGGQADRDTDGFYFAENGDFSWRATSERIATEANERGLLKSVELENLSVEEADKMWEYGSFFWGTDSRSRAARAREVLEWKPVESDIFEDVPNVVHAEAGALGLTK